MDLKLKNKISLVCAASEGLGKAAALELAKEGSTIAISSRNKEKLELAKNEISSETGSEVKIYEADLTSEDQIINLYKQVQTDLGEVEILVNNIGGPPPGSFESLSDQDWQDALNLTMLSAIRMSRTVLPQMKVNGWGRIINISSVSVKTPVNSLFLSNSIRLGVLGWAKALSDEVAEHGITVNSVCPGMTRTNRISDINSKISEKSGMPMEEVEKNSSQSIPMRRIGEPEELAALIAFLASERASYITGTAIQVDGGSSRTYS